MEIKIAEELYEGYDRVCKEFVKNFEKKECVEFESLSLKRVCSGDFEVLFLTQFEIDGKKSCKKDKELLEGIRKETILYNNFLEMSEQEQFDFDDLFELIAPGLDFPELMETKFNYLKGDEFYEPPSSIYIAEKVISALSLLCRDFAFT